VDFSAIRLVVSDMDGTLLNSRHELDPEFYVLFRELRQRGIHFAAASGRQYHNIRNVFSSIQRDMYFIAENGGYVMHRDEELFVQEMDSELTYSLIRDAKKIEETFTILCGKKKAYIEDTTEFFVEHLARYYDEYEVVDDLLKVKNDQFLKIAICDMSGAEGNTYQLFKGKADQLQIKISGNIWLDISHKRANKGEALKKVQEVLGIDPSETIVFGDYLNDLEMMQQADFSFAMENAHPQVKRVARFIAPSNDERGVLQILRQVLSHTSEQ
jgi:Cof subfamily protein (haloacid dehalogenase superfamily)